MEKQNSLWVKPLHRLLEMFRCDANGEQYVSLEGVKTGPGVRISSEYQKGWLEPLFVRVAIWNGENHDKWVISPSVGECERLYYTIQPENVYAEARIAAFFQHLIDNFPYSSR